MVTIVVFGISLFLILGMLIMKQWSLRNGKNSFLLRLLGRLDPLAEKLTSSAKFRALQLLQSIRYLILVRLPELVGQTATKYKDRMTKKLEIQHSLLMGHKDIQNKGAVSFFLKKMGEAKMNGQKGEINESL